MSAPDWREAVAAGLTKYMRGSGISRFNASEAKTCLRALASKDRKLVKHSRVGYAYVYDTYTESGMSRFMKMVEEEWETPVSEPLQSQAQDGSAHKFECVISIALNADTYKPDTIHKTFQDYLISAIEEPFGCMVVQVVKVHACWYDMKIRYSVSLCDIFKLVIAPDWVIDAQTKPASEFGKLTLGQV